MSTALATIDKDMLAQWHGKPAADGTHPVYLLAYCVIYLPGRHHTNWDQLKLPRAGIEHWDTPPYALNNPRAIPMMRWASLHSP